MTRKKAVELATQRIMAVQLRELAQGKMDQKTFDTVRESRAAQIEDLADDILRPRRAVKCCACKRAVTTTIAGKGYCSAHAAGATRPDLPAKLTAA